MPTSNHIALRPFDQFTFLQHHNASLLHTSYFESYITEHCQRISSVTWLDGKGNRFPLNPIAPHSCSELGWNRLPPAKEVPSVFAELNFWMVPQKTKATIICLYILPMWDMVVLKNRGTPNRPKLDHFNSFWYRPPVDGNHILIASLLWSVKQLRGMLLQMQAFGHVNPDSAEPADWNGALQNAWDDFTTWRRYNKISSSQKRFKFRMLCRDEYGFFLNCKGFNARLISEWLLSVIVEIKHSPPPGLVPDDRFDLCLTALILGPKFH